jgi:iron complex transport system permease protein
MTQASTTVRTVAPRAATPGRLLQAPAGIMAVLLVLLFIAMFVATTIGAAGIPVHRLLAAFGLTDGDPTLIARDWLVLWSIRLPRIAVAAIVGGLLATSGAIMQGLFRNPLADPGLDGVSSGAGLVVAGTIVGLDRLAGATGPHLPTEASPLAAFVGALATTWILYRIATRDGRTSVVTFLLGGLAIAALANAGTGLLIFLADDRQLRDITFWTLGSLAGATWGKLAALLPFLLLTVLAMPVIARGLDLLALGESEAYHSGIAVEWLKRGSIVLVAAAAGASVAICGVIGFVGIIVPHVLRLTIGPAHRLLLPATMLAGAILLVAADTVARIIVSPAELPIGILTAIVGAPFFLYLLMRQRWVVVP